MNAGLERYNTVARDLASLYQERAGIENVLTDTWSAAYNLAIGDGQSHNPAAAQAKIAASHWQKELNKINGDIEAYLVELRYLDQLLKYVKDSGGQPG